MEEFSNDSILDLELKAKVILNETDTARLTGVKELREWIHEKQHVFSCPIDEGFLVRFLRQGKFDQNVTRKRLKLYIKLYCCDYKGRPDLFNSLPLTEEEISLFVAAKTLLPLGHARKNGPFVILGRLSDFDENFFSRKLILQCWIMYAIWLSTKPRIQVNGISFISDLKDITMSMFMKFYEINDIKVITAFLQDAMPMRIEQLILYREPKVISIVFPIVEPLIHENIRARIYRVKDDLELLEEKIEGLGDILPREYNGKGPSIEEISERSKTELMNFWKINNEKFEWHKKKQNFLSNSAFRDDPLLQLN